MRLPPDAYQHGQPPTGKFRFNLVAPNGQVIATSEAYESKASAINGIESVKRNACGVRKRGCVWGARTKAWPPMITLAEGRCGLLS